MSQTPPASSADFAAQLAFRLSEVVPSGFTVAAENARVVLRHHGETIGSTSMAELVESSENLDHFPGNLETAGRTILSAVQDWVADATSQPWPGDRVQPNPGAKFDGQTMVMWYGEENDPVLRLRPIHIS